MSGNADRDAEGNVDGGAKEHPDRDAGSDPGEPPASRGAEEEVDEEDGGEDDAVDAAGENDALGGAQDDSADGHESLLAALRVRRHARVGLAVGVGLAAVLYLQTLPSLGRSLEGAEGYYLGLAFVLAATTAAVVTAALSVATFLGPVIDRAAWHRRGAMAAILGGLGWAGTPLLAAAVDAGAIDVEYWRSATSLACVALLVGTVALHAAVKPGAVERGEALRRIERAAYWTVLVGLLIAAANATGDPAPVTTEDGGAVATPFLAGAVLASAAAIPFAAAAERSGRVPRYRTRALQIGALLGTLGVAWLLLLDGWRRLQGLDPSAESVALAVALVPVGLGWAIAGWGLWSAGLRGLPPARTDEHRTELDGE